MQTPTIFVILFQSYVEWLNEDSCIFSIHGVYRVQNRAISSQEYKPAEMAIVHLLSHGHQ